MPANPLDDGQSLPDATSGLTRQTQPIAYPGARSRNDRLTLTTKPAVVGVLAVGVREIGGSGTQCGCGGLQGRCCRSAVDGGRHGNRSTSMLLSGVTEASLCTDLDRPQFHTGRNPRDRTAPPDQELRVHRRAHERSDVPDPTRHSQELYVSPEVCVFDVHCWAPKAGWGDEELCLFTEIIVPRRGVFVSHRHGHPVVADCNTALVLQAGDVQRVSHPTDAGDECTALAFAPELLDQALRPETARHGRLRPTTQLGVRLLTSALSGDGVDRLQAEEAALLLRCPVRGSWVWSVAGSATHRSSAVGTGRGGALAACRRSGVPLEHGCHRQGGALLFVSPSTTVSSDLQRKSPSLPCATSSRPSPGTSGWR